MLARALARSIGGDFSRDPGHARPAALRPHRHHRVRPGPARVPLPARPDLRERRARRRDQPHDAADAVGAPGAHGGAAGDGRGRDAHAAHAVPGDRHGEPDRTARHVPAARGAARPVLAHGLGRLSRARSGASDIVRRQLAAPPDRGPRARARARRGRAVPARGARGPRGPRPSIDYVVAARACDADRARGRARRVAARHDRAHAVRAGSRDRRGTRLRAARRREGARAGRARAPADPEAGPQRAPASAERWSAGSWTRSRSRSASSGGS